MFPHHPSQPRVLLSLSFPFLSTVAAFLALLHFPKSELEACAFSSFSSISFQTKTVICLYCTSLQLYISDSLGKEWEEIMNIQGTGRSDVT